MIVIETMGRTAPAVFAIALLVRRNGPRSLPKMQP